MVQAIAQSSEDVLNFAEALATVVGARIFPSEHAKSIFMSYLRASGYDVEKERKPVVLNGEVPSVEGKK